MGYCYSRNIIGPGRAGGGGGGGVLGLKLSENKFPMLEIQPES